MVDLLNDWRRSNPDAPLSQLVQQHSQANEHLLDLACIDLINRRRAGREVFAQEYVQDLSELSDECCLDLIDAEICVDRELGRTIEPTVYTERYPKFASEIIELCQMVPEGTNKVTGIELERCNLHTGSHVNVPASIEEASAATDFTYDRTFSTETEISVAEHPIDLPPWFTRQHCIASGQGHWLIRGRDSSRNQSLAMKIVRLPSQVNDNQVKELLDICEQTANVPNPCWLSPEIAAVQDRHLAVVRPWSFAIPWQNHCNTIDHKTRTRQLALVAYALQGAHRTGATHGGVHEGNLLIDHDGNPQLVDCGSSFRGLQRWLSSGATVQAWADRQISDVNDLVRMVTNETIDWPIELSQRLVPELRKLADFHRDDACGVIGDKLMHWADCELSERVTTPKVSPSWQSRLRSWFGR